MLSTKLVRKLDSFYASIADSIINIEKEFLSDIPFDDSLKAVMQNISISMNLKRISIFENHEKLDKTFMSLIYMYDIDADDWRDQYEKLQNIEYDTDKLTNKKIFESGKSLCGTFCNNLYNNGLFEDEESFKCMPIMLKEKVWGFVIFEPLNKHNTSNVHYIKGLQIFTIMIGSAIIKERSKNNLLINEKRLIEQHNILSAMNSQMHDYIEIQKQIYKDLEVAKQYQRAILDAEASMVIATLGAVMWDCNNAFLEFTGYKTIEDFKKIHSSVSDLFEPETDYLHSEMDGLEWIEYMRQNPDNEFRVLMKNKNGEKYIFNVKMNDVILDGTNISVFTFSNITELVRYRHNLENEIQSALEEIRHKDRILHSQAKSAQMGEMIGMIAHQWRQPLNAISASAIAVSMKNELGELKESEIRDHLKFVQNQMQNMSKIINDFMNFFKPDSDVESFTIEDIINDVMSLMGAQLESRGIKLELDSSSNDSIISHRKEFAHIILNLIANTRDAYESSTISSEQKTIKIHHEADSNKHIIYINDHAGGIPEEHIDRVFDPYFTTKEQGKGTGIGLYMCSRIVHEVMHGTISVSNTEDGARFMITLPLS